MDAVFQETLELLEWPLVCEHLSTFASTPMGRSAARKLDLPKSISQSISLQAETIEMSLLDDLIEGGVSFRGVQDLRPTLIRCKKGGVSYGEELLAVAETLGSARRIRRQINDPDLRPFCTNLIQQLVTLPELEHCLKSALEEGGRVTNNASSLLFRLRQQRELLRENRRGILQELLRHSAPFLQDNIIADRNGRPVLAVKAAGLSHVPGLVHDSSSSGSTIFVEPRSVLYIGNQIVNLEARIRE